MVKHRSEMDNDDLWNVQNLYPDFDAWEADYQEFARDGQNPRWPEIAYLAGKLGDNPETLKTALQLILGLSRKLGKLSVYAHLRHDEDITNDEAKANYARITNTMHAFAQETSWFEPELLSLSQATFKEILDSPMLKEFRFYLERIDRMKPHTLSRESEELLASAGYALFTPYKTFSALNDADLKFGTITDKEGKTHQITHGQYGMLIRDQDRDLRERTFRQYFTQFQKHENTLCELLNGEVHKNVFQARARKYRSAMEASLYPHNIDPQVYRSLIEAVNNNLSVLHRYFDLRKKVLGVDQLHLYDMHVPLTPSVDIRMEYDVAEKAIIDSVAPLGKTYQDILAKGLLQDRWVDRYENENKRSGAYSSGCFDSMPYILMNYKGIIRDVFTLSHEAGHSMHSYLSRKNQVYHYADYPIFVAEVASTFNEELLMNHLLNQFTSKTEQIFLINQKIEDIRGTLFRQTMFAEFELRIHELVEMNAPLTPKVLKEEYMNLLNKYFGPSVFIDQEGEVEWGRIPHFYYNFYVYQYATGISAALALTKKVTSSGAKERDAYLNFLSSGSSRYPIDLLASAGVDMRTPEPVTAAIQKFDQLVTKLEGLLSESSTGIPATKQRAFSSN